MTVSNAIFRSIFEAAAEGMLVCDTSGTILIVNESCAQMFGYSREEMLEMKIEALIPANLKEIHARHRKSYMQDPKKRKMGIGLALEARRKNGATFPVEIGLNHAIIEGEPLAVALISDISESLKQKLQLEEALAELKRYSIDLEKSNNELQEFAYVASHDLQEPLRMVAAYTQILHEEYSERLDDVAKEYMEFAVSGAQRMHRLIHDLLIFSRVESHSMEFGTIDLNTVIIEVLESLKDKISNTEAEIKVGTLPRIKADHSQMYQLFLNLISNALKYRSEKKPLISIECFDTDKHYEFHVRDNGIGIDMKYAPRIFKVFQRLHAQDEYEGSGIGLAVCKKIIERHSGNIRVESKPGEGSDFIFTIPK